MIERIPPSRLPVPVAKPTRLPAVVRPAAADADKRRGAAEAYAGAPPPDGPRGRVVDLLV